MVIKMAKHYTIADIHGMYNIYEQVCAMLQPDDIIYFLGDAADRGYACFKTMKAIYENPQWVYLKGNHEQMMIDTLLYANQYRDDYLHNPMTLWFNNGGSDTFNEWLEEGGDSAWADRLDHLSTKIDYVNDKGIIFHLSHAGYTCGRLDQMWNEELIWNRNHFYNQWDEEKYPNDICIHGHTPIEVLVHKLKQFEQVVPFDREKPEARIYCNGHKIDIDNGVFYTGKTILYDLDDMIAIPLEDKNFNKEECLYV
jgi:calcineurin-like phosphoesterase family protein